MQKHKQAFANRFREALAELGYQGNEQKALGKLFGVSGQAVRKWLDAESLPSTSRSAEVAKILGVRRAWLMDGELPKRAQAVKVKEKDSSYNKDVSISVDEMDFLQTFRKLSKTQRQTLIAFVKSIKR